VEPELTGKDLKKLGYIPGPQYRKMLTALKNARLDNITHNREEEINLLKKKYPEKLA
jgi:tRNA nucleotidyltransferase (CCA-adding enzyme)